jgi:hypothetical protein
VSEHKRNSTKMDSCDFGKHLSGRSGKMNRKAEAGQPKVCARTKLEGISFRGG